jgi:hypothetical protein
MMHSYDGPGPKDNQHEASLEKHHLAINKDSTTNFFF